MSIAMRAAAIFLMVMAAASQALADSSEGNGAATASPTTVAAEAPLVLFNRTIFTFRGHFLGATPQVRAQRAKAALEETLARDGQHLVSVKPNPEGQFVVIDDRLAFVVTAGDADPLLQQTSESVAKDAARNLEQLVSETRESRSLHSVLIALAVSGIATLVFVSLLWALRRFRAWSNRVVLQVAQNKAKTLKIGGTQLIDELHLVPFFKKLLSVLHWLFVVLLSYEWLSLVLSRFPYTRPWGERLNDYLLNVVGNLLEGIVSTIPGMGVALAIFVLARFSISLLSGFFERVANAESTVSWISPNTMPTTRRLANIGIWLFAIAMAYPYLPGAQTEAFKGLSLLIGLMVSLGTSSIVGQGAAGLILTYTRTILPGEYVRIGEHEGTVVAIGMFTTRIRTGLGEELTLPNSVITGTVTKNYSRVVQGTGYIIDTTVTIGYDTPWRQVEAMLIEAARRTQGILEAPKPVVFQTALSDYYPEYRLVAQAIPTRPRPRAEVLSMLHANIQDVFNEYGVQIMSPHYMTDATERKIVKPADWFPAPANKDQR